MLPEQFWCGSPSTFRQWCSEVVQEHQEYLERGFLLSAYPEKILSLTVLAGLGAGELYLTLLSCQKIKYLSWFSIADCYKIHRLFVLENVLQGNMQILQKLDKRHDKDIYEIN